MCNHDNLKADNPTVGILREGERIDNIGFGDMKLIQKPEEFCYGVDAVILADFAAGYHKGKTDIVVDLGTGTGVIPLILSYKLDCVKIYGVELQPDSWERACRNAENNGLTDRIEFLNFDVKDIGESWGTELRGNADIVVSNPPYFKSGGAIKNDTAAKTIARHETSAGINDFLASASYLLKPKGELFYDTQAIKTCGYLLVRQEKQFRAENDAFCKSKAGSRA